MVTKYIPQQGDIVSLNYYSKKNGNLSEFLPAVVISNNAFNQNTKMVMVCPIIASDITFPTHYLLEDTINVHGLVLCEHVKAIDYENRKLKYIEKLSNNDLISVITLFNSCIEE